MRLKGDEHHEWERVKIWQRVTKGAQSPNGLYFNWEKGDKTKSGGYIDGYEWHLEGTEQQPVTDTGEDVSSFITYEEKNINKRRNNGN